MWKTNRSSGLICLSPHRDYDSHRWVRMPVGSQLPRHGDRAFPLHGHNRPPGLLQRSSALRSQQENTGERSKVSRPLTRTTHSRHTERSYSQQTAAFITHLSMRFTFTCQMHEPLMNNRGINLFVNIKILGKINDSMKGKIHILYNKTKTKLDYMFILRTFFCLQ